MSDNIPPVPAKALRIILNLKHPEKRLDAVLLAALREQNENPELKEISRVKFKALFEKGRIRIKGQIAKPSSSLAAGLTYIDVIGMGADR